MYSNQQNQRDPNAYYEFCLFPAVTLMVFTRRRIGLRLLTIPRMLGALVLLYFWTLSGSVLLGGPFKDMRAPEIFAGLFAIFSVNHYLRGWREFNRGSRLHTYSAGTSRLEGIRLPMFIRRYRRIYRFAEPMLWLVVGLCVMSIAATLGLWIVIASFALASFEHARYKAVLDRDLEIVDGVSEAEIQQQMVEYFSVGKPQDRALVDSNADETKGIPTGLARDIEAQIEERKKTGTSGSESP